MNAPKKSHLQTKFVFLDTEAMKHVQFDWNGRHLSTIVDLARQGDIAVLTTSITKAEIIAHLNVGLAETLKSLQKHRATLLAMGLESAVNALTDAETSKALLEGAFFGFLNDCRAIEIPLDVNVSALFESYFSRQPPFTEKKKSEFPDAAVIMALKEWCKAKNQSIYVVSGDPDLIGCCTPEGPLLHSPSISEIIDQALVSREIHETLENLIIHDQGLGELLSDDIKELSVKIDGLWRYRSRIEDAKAEIGRIDGITIHSARILKHVGDKFECEIEFEAEIVFNVEVDVLGYYEDDGYHTTFIETFPKTVPILFNSIIEVRFDPAQPNDLEVDSFFISLDTIELEVEQILNQSRIPLW